MCSLVEELQSQLGLGVGSLGYHQQTARILVYAMHQTHLGVVGVVALDIAQMPGEGVDQCTREVAHAGVNHEAGGLVDHHQLAVFIDHIEWYVLGLDRGVVARTVEHERDHIARAHAIIALHGAVVDMHKTGIGGTLYAVAARVLQLFEHILVYAQRLLTAVHDKSEVLVELGFAFEFVYILQVDVFVCHYALYI